MKSGHWYRCQADNTRERETARQRGAAPKGQILPGTSQAKGARGQATVERSATLRT
ncbi:hypothetical protein Pen02_25690 [Plantactinospora endophytica]|uniref:Uncharacterized protein n=1 Tax=Plantactinospora endophytica TaxID=673535 RepID=A0ABQ4DYY4_9ACTN|nr:hypothetical protein Pen02_25690 [Plantactinospora endophytica]